MRKRRKTREVMNMRRHELVNFFHYVFVSLIFLVIFAFKSDEVSFISRDSCSLGKFCKGIGEHVNRGFVCINVDCVDMLFSCSFFFFFPSSSLLAFISIDNTSQFNSV